MPFPSRLKKQKKDDEDGQLLLIFKQIHINLPFLEAMIHMPKGAKVLKDLLSHKEKLEKAASSVKLSEECSAIIQRILPQKEGDPGSFILPCLIRPLEVKKALSDLGARETEKEGPNGAELSIIPEPAPRPSIFYQPSKSSNMPFPSRLKKQKKDDEDGQLLLIFKQIHINLPFLEAMIHMPKGAKVLKDLLSHKEKLEKAASSVKLSEEYSAIIQRSLPQKEGDPGSFILPYLIGPLEVKKALSDL
ncbi:hypothetical protein Tco_0602527 [Tanacetum coccineum]